MGLGGLYIFLGLEENEGEGEGRKIGMDRK